MPVFTTLFIVFLLADILIRGWLAWRQIRHVAHHRNAVPAGFQERISLRSHQRAADYTRAKVALGFLETLAGAALLVVLTLLGGLQFINEQLAQSISGDLLRQVCLVAAVMLCVTLLALPFSIWRKFRIDAHFGFNRLTPRLFISDLIKTVLVSVALGVPLVAVILWLMGNAGAAWGWWAWGVWLAFNFLLLYLFPLVIAPLFNTFTPLENPEVKERITALAKKCDFLLDGLFVMDGSKRSGHGNAYFTGLGKSRRIVFFDTLLRKLAPDEIEAVMAHELGHFKHRHILKRLILNFVLALVFFQVLAWLSQQTWFYTSLGVAPLLGRANDALALLLFFLVIPVFTFWMGPLFNVLSRRDEFEADRYAARQSSANALVSALIKLYDDNASSLTPDPVHSAFYDSHPPALQRLQRLSNEY